MPWNTEGPDPSGSAPGQSEAPQRAAVAMWVTAAVQMIVFGCCSLLLAGVGMLPEQTLRQEMSEQMPSDQLDQLVQGQPLLLIGAIVLMLVMFLPALVLLLLGFRVRSRRLGSARAARVILYAQAGLLAVVLAWYALVGAMQGVLLGICMPLVVLGGVLALVIWASRTLRTAINELRQQELDEINPWNSPPT